jgi:hypothetical protein
MGKILSWLGGLPFWVYGGLILLALLGAQTARLHLSENATQRAQDAHQKTKVENAAVLQQIAALTAKAQAEVRLREIQYSKDSAESRTQAIQEFRDALNIQDRTIADLRAGNLRLRKQWTCDSGPAGNGPAAGALGPADDAAADLREADSGSLVRIGANADTLVRWLQREVLATRKACAVP